MVTLSGKALSFDLRCSSDFLLDGRVARHTRCAAGLADELDDDAVEDVEALGLLGGSGLAGGAGRRGAR